LLAGLVTVAVAGLVVADVVIYHQVDAYLGTQIDNELSAVSPQQVSIVNGQLVGGLFNPNTRVQDAVGEVLDLQGHRVGQVNLGSDSLVIPSSVLPAERASANGPNAGDSIVTFTTRTRTGHIRYRAQAELLQFRFTNDLGILVVGIPLTSVEGTLHQLLVTELLVTAGVLLLLLGLGYAVVRIGLRPLGAIEETAAAIAAGDLSRRVPSDNERTEVGRLGRSLNVMLARIEQAFSEQRASEGRLRQFISDASHELRTPVTSIRGYAELFRRGAASRPEDLALAMRRIEDESIRMGGLVEDLLLLARLDEGRPLERTPVNLAAIAADSVADAKAVDPDRVVVLSADSTVMVEGDEARLRQVVANLMQNAQRYTPRDAAVAVSARTVGDRAVLTVSDEGPGIAADIAAHVFERFYRGDPSRTRERGGSGLGLAIVASIAEAHGGGARVESAVGHGARFIVEIPLARPPVGTPTPTGSWQTTTSPPPGSPELDAGDGAGRSEASVEEPIDGRGAGTDGLEDHRGDVVPADEAAEVRD
jgi:two-component system OmpR family sensor kinase